MRAPSDGERGAVAHLDRGTALLQLRGLKTGYEKLPVLHGITFDVAHGETVAVLGLNGAGKTTLMLALAGALPLWEGEIIFDGGSIGALPAPKRVGRGIALVPEGRRVFPGLTVDRNLELGAWASKLDRGVIRQRLTEMYELFPQLAERRRLPAAALSGGEQQMLAIGRALMSQPRILLIDEASLGLAPIIIDRVFDLIRRIAEGGVTVVMVEQNVAALDLADRALILQKGAIVFEDAAAALKESDEVRRAYLG